MPSSGSSWLWWTSMTTLSYQRGEWGKRFTTSCPKISIGQDSVQEPTEVFDLFWRCNYEYCLYFLRLWLNARLCEDIPWVFHFHSTECRLSGIDSQSHFSQPGKGLVSSDWGGRPGLPWWCLSNHPIKFWWTFKATIRSDIFAWKIVWRTCCTHWWPEVRSKTSSLMETWWCRFWMHQCPNEWFNSPCSNQGLLQKWIFLTLLHCINFWV